MADGDLRSGATSRHAYVGMLYNRGRYLAPHGRHPQAIAAFRAALAFDPNFALAQWALADSARALGTPE